MHRKYVNDFSLFVLLLFAIPVLGQEQGSIDFVGRVSGLDGPLPFATMGILNANVGTVCDERGVFELAIPSEHINDTLRVSYLGYQIQSFIPSQIELESRLDWEIRLENDPIALRPVVVFDQKAKQYRLGSKKNGDLFVWVSSQGKGAEAATRLSPKKPIFLNTIEVEILNEKEDQFTLLLNLYKENEITQLPGEPLLQREILVESNQKEGWLVVELGHENIILNEPFFVSFKWVNVSEQGPKIGVNDKLKSYTRYVALGKWQKLFNWNIRAEGVRISTK